MIKHERANGVEFMMQVLNGVNTIFKPKKKRHTHRHTDRINDIKNKTMITNEFQ